MKVESVLWDTKGCRPSKLKSEYFFKGHEKFLIWNIFCSKNCMVFLKHEL